MRARTPSAAARGAADGGAGAAVAGAAGAEDACKFIPFSLGQRACPGMHLAEAEIHILVEELLRSLSWEPEPWSGIDLREWYSLTLQPAVSQSLRFSPVAYRNDVVV
uniref:Cytochrome P450 n=1 Tax=Eutreptiella gymnastica TaxID=73025 RepID=A0A7S4D316_9EUGL